ncbi:MBL fold metallo-hydrolase [Inediibacterium massiliense]|uniref:MBL fold metallo-hydrolase n=1 Tax=Inediibacterium massiliense TaxID=1658111 RepID=UPI0006B555E4|nr:MBL fold metallo-hydrolase [Inediibacterium massiliense]
MELKKIKGNTYCILSGTNVGVFLFKDKYTLLIDTGNNNQQARKNCEILGQNNMNIKYVFNTHHHIDHAGGNYFLKENYPGSIIYSSSKEKLYIENEDLFIMNLYGASPIKMLRKEFIHGKNIEVDAIVEEGMEKINNEKFEIISLPGHTKGQIGIGTKDGVFFLADSLMSEEIFKKYKMPFLMDIKDQMNTYDKILSLDYEYYLLSHGNHIYNKEEIKTLVQKNKDNLEKYIEICKELLAQPKTREELLEEVIVLEDLEVDFKEYHFLHTTIGAILTYLCEEELSYEIENGKLYFYK